jgi:hypothetical protein
MDNELTALATSGATTLVSIMATDSWTHARGLIARLLTRNAPGRSTLRELDDAHSQLTGADPLHAHQAAAELIAQWTTHLQHLMAADPAARDELRSLLRSLERLTGTATTPAVTVHNEINGDIHHAPVIQAGRIHTLTLYTPAPQRPEDNPS